MALMLLAGAGLLLASFRALLAVVLGFEPHGVLTARVDLPASRYEDDAAHRSFAERALARIRSLPGVERAGITNLTPFGGDEGNYPIFAEGHTPRPGESIVSPSSSVVTPESFESMGIRVIDGRGFDDRDTPDGRRVIVLDGRLAKRLWPEGYAVGRRVWRSTNSGDFRDPSEARYSDVVGIVTPIHMRGVLAPADQMGAYYFPICATRGRRLRLYHSDVG
jgi:putative ABC transport system permease protein